MTHKSFMQRQLDQILGNDEDGHEPGLLASPTIAYAPETGWELGVSLVLVYYANDNVKNRLSEANGFLFLTEKEQYGLALEHTIYTDHNVWFFYGSARAQSFPLQYYGIGAHATADVKANIDSNYVWVRERVLRQLVGSLYIGLELELELVTDVTYKPEKGFESLPRPLGATGNTSLGLGVGLVYDSCANAMNERNGILAEIGFLTFPDVISTFPMTSLFFDGRIFRPTTATHVIAAQVSGKFTLGDVPFDEMAMLGGGMIMRGFYMGRYRDRNALSAQVEYRLLPIIPGWRIGAAAFAAIGAVSSSLSFERWLWAAGAGPRLLLFPKKDIFIRLDFAVTSEGTGTYLFMGEAF